MLIASFVNVTKAESVSRQCLLKRWHRATGSQKCTGNRVSASERIAQLIKQFNCHGRIGRQNRITKMQAGRGLMSLFGDLVGD
jgi:hypothetical protein